MTRHLQSRCGVHSHFFLERHRHRCSYRSCSRQDQSCLCRHADRVPCQGQEAACTTVM